MRQSLLSLKTSANLVLHVNLNLPISLEWHFLSFLDRDWMLAQIWWRLCGKQRTMSIWVTRALHDFVPARTILLHAEAHTQGQSNSWVVRKLRGVLLEFIQKIQGSARAHTTLYYIKNTVSSSLQLQSLTQLLYGLNVNRESAVTVKRRNFENKDQYWVERQGKLSTN